MLGYVTVMTGMEGEPILEILSSTRWPHRDMLFPACLLISYSECQENQPSSECNLTWDMGEASSVWKAEE